MPGKIFTLKFVYEVSTAGLKLFAVAFRCAQVLFRGEEVSSALPSMALGESGDTFPTDHNRNRFKSEQSHLHSAPSLLMPLQFMKAGHV